MIFSIERGFIAYPLYFYSKCVYTYINIYVVNVVYMHDDILYTFTYNNIGILSGLIFFIISFITFYLFFFFFSMAWRNERCVVHGGGGGLVVFLFLCRKNGFNITKALLLYVFMYLLVWGYINYYIGCIRVGIFRHFLMY